MIGLSAIVSVCPQNNCQVVNPCFYEMLKDTTHFELAIFHCQFR
jgi:hypothetical protein